MRIRSIKPEFWRSEDITALDWQTRLVFIGLWSYVDDNGVGKDNERAITADLFALEEDPRDTLATVSRALARLADAGLIERYSVAERNFLHVNTWDAHQKIDRPGKPRYPLPTSEDAIPRDTLATPSREVRDTLDPGTGEQGAGEQWSRGLTPLADAPVAQPAAVIDLRSEETSSVVATATPAQTSQTLIAEWVEHCEGNPPKRVLGQIAKGVKELLDEDIPYDAVRAGLAVWHERRLHPSTLASVVHEIRQGPPRQRNGRPSPTERALSTLAIGERLQAQDDDAMRVNVHTLFPELGA